MFVYMIRRGSVKCRFLWWSYGFVSVSIRPSITYSDVDILIICHNHRIVANTSKVNSMHSHPPEHCTPYIHTYIGINRFEFSAYTQSHVHTINIGTLWQWYRWNKIDKMCMRGEQKSERAVISFERRRKQHQYSG